MIKWLVRNFSCNGQATQLSISSGARARAGGLEFLERISDPFVLGAGWGRVGSPTMAVEPNPARVYLNRPSWPSTSYRDILMQIGQAMRRHYELPQELPDRLYVLLEAATGPTTTSIDARAPLGRSALADRSVESRRDRADSSGAEETMSKRA